MKQDREKKKCALRSMFQLILNGKICSNDRLMLFDYRQETSAYRISTLTTFFFFKQKSTLNKTRHFALTHTLIVLRQSSRCIQLMNAFDWNEKSIKSMFMCCFCCCCLMSAHHWTMYSDFYNILSNFCFLFTLIYILYKFVVFYVFQIFFPNRSIQPF